jgi:ATP-dependent DNA helicase DinG
LEIPANLVSKAIDKLEDTYGFSKRPSQRQLSLLISDLLEGSQSGIFEAPTGVGKSLAALIPSLIHACTSGKRVVIATYTNVLAEQYFKKEVPFALELLSDLLPVKPDVRILMGRQRYCCIAQLGELDQKLRSVMLSEASIGHETEFKRVAGLPLKVVNALWPKVSTPVVCASTLCPDYRRCYYYNGRRLASKAQLVITNHSVVVQDALMKESEGSEGLLGDYDFLILDEAHDFHLAAANGLEFELNESKLKTLSHIGAQLGKMLEDLATASGVREEWNRSVADFEADSRVCREELNHLSRRLSRPGVVIASPDSLFQNQLVQNHKADLSVDEISKLGFMVENGCRKLSEASDRLLSTSVTRNVAQTESVRDTIRNYRRYLDEFGSSIRALILPQGVSVTHASHGVTGPKIRLDTIALSEPLQRILWSQIPTVFLSATLALDGGFEFFKSLIGCQASFEEILEAPYDYARQAALYLPKSGVIPDPTESRKNRSEPAYYQAVASEIDRIIQTCKGRTLVLFHSRREMEGVGALIPRRPEFPILIQSTQGVAEIGEQFRRSTNASLFGLRSFWTGFDAPGPTLSCVVLVRIPFEVPIDPPQIARSAHLQIQGLNPFASYSLPMAKTLVRQGVGRLIRGSEDIGVIALLDPRIHSKTYGQQFLDNLPQGMTAYFDIEEAAGLLEPALTATS